MHIESNLYDLLQRAQPGETVLLEELRWTVLNQHGEETQSLKPARKYTQMTCCYKWYCDMCLFWRRHSLGLAGGQLGVAKPKESADGAGALSQIALNNTRTAAQNTSGIAPKYKWSQFFFSDFSNDCTLLLLALGKQISVWQYWDSSRSNWKSLVHLGSVQYALKQSCISRFVF